MGIWAAGQGRVVGEVLLAAATVATGGTTGVAKVGGGTYKFAELMAESGETSRTMARIYYEIGQMTLADAPQVANPIIRGAEMVEEVGWIRALAPTWRGLLFGAGTTLRTGPTTAGWVGASGLILGAKCDELRDSGYLSDSSGGSVSIK